MALVVADRVRETTSTSGTGSVTLNGSTDGYQAFSVIGNGNSTYYCIVSLTGPEWEVGVGTYSSTGPTLSRDTVLSSSNANSLVNFSTGTKDVFITYPAGRSLFINAAGTEVTTLDVGTLGATTANLDTATITAGTVSTAPLNSTDLVNKQYVDTIAVQSIHYHQAVKYEVPLISLNATYNNGSSGVGATLTNAGTLVAFTPDGTVASVGDRILVYNQSNPVQNGVYTVTTVGSGSVAWVLTRATDANTYDPISPNGLGGGDAFFVQAGTIGAGETYVCDNTGTIVFGTTPITFAQISDSTLYTAGTGLTLNGTEFSITPVGTASTYGSASQVPVFTTNASGQIASVTNTSIAISSGAVSGLAASATTDTTNASNITSGTLPSAQLSGTYTGITGVGTLTAGGWQAGTIAAAYGGTGLTSYTVGDLLYASGTTTLAKLNDIATGNALLSGGVGTAPAWGKVNLQTHITDTLQVSNGGTGATTLTGYVYGNGTGAFTASTSIPNSATTATSANTASAIVARDGSGNFSAGTITASLSGNASTATSATSATTATNLAGGVAGAVPYQSASGTTGFSGVGSVGQVLTSAGTGTPTWSTPASPNNGTLTLATSGTGLSGSATFTADQAGNSTFTVTSNATNANTASTIVARDSAGDFSAGTITATLSGTATQVSNSLTLATSGTGLSGSATFNGGSAQTFTVTSNATNANTASTIVARDASGNFSAGTITASLSGNATSATTATTATTATQVSNSLTLAVSGTGLSGSATFNGSSAQTFTVTSNATNANTASTIVARDASGNFSAGTITASLSGNASTATTASATTAAVTFNSSGGAAAGTSFNGSTARTVDYSTVGAPSTTGTGASGTWGISISGNAATVTNGLTTSNYSSYALPLGGGTMTGLITGKTNTGGSVSSSNDTGSFSARGDGSNAAVISFHRPGIYAINMGLDTNNTFRIGGWSATANAFSMDGSGNLTMTGNVTANSDERLKTNWRALPADFVEQLAKVKRGVYDRTDITLTQVGVSAQSLKPVLPSAVAADDAGILSVNYGNAALVSAVELAERVVAQEARIAKLEALVAELTKGMTP